MFAFIWPIALVVLSNTIYQICSKSMPPEVHPFASLTVTYLVGAVLSGVMFFVLNPGGNLVREYGKLNLAPFALGIVVVGLEVGFVYAYKAGWQVSTASSPLRSLSLAFCFTASTSAGASWSASASVSSAWPSSG